MYLSQISLTNFRNFDRKVFKFDTRFTFVFGKNSQGKTNLLEAINMLLKGAGFRDSKEEELIKLVTQHASVEGKLIDDDQNISFKIDLVKKDYGLEKNYYLGRTKKTRHLYLKEVMSAVLFSPEQIEIIIGPPAIRRNYFDKFLSSTDPVYKTRLNNYYQALKKRNRIFERVHNENELKEELEFWNQYLIDNGSYLTEKRKKYAEFLNSNKKIDSKVFSVKYNENVFNKTRLTEYFHEEKRLRKTLIGPQRDNFQIYLADLDVNLYGSRSEERLALFWLKMNELKYWEGLTKKKPILLLDDIFSELDIDNQRLVISLIGNYQTVATSTDRTLLKLIDFSNNAADHTIDL